MENNTWIGETNIIPICFKYVLHFAHKIGLDKMVFGAVLLLGYSAHILHSVL
jgi:hypothetical protein